MFYLLSSLQASVSVHKCLGQVKSISISHTVGSCAGEYVCGLPCCDDVTLSLESSEEGEIGVSLDFQSKPISTLKASFDDLTIILLSEESSSLIPEYRKAVHPIPTYLMNSCLIFYA